ncbi:PREDICTED: calvin cycle protein CP12-1, chloroplastic [Nelumbo nucifera]|uniref:Calvin cycle protein CP12-1, chloroplastic n=2 Tax=Nelumbo nucifera TaxID=4432 RepID=A0A1U8A3D4_NELNU|nr:PREDICTED: calvin cycle protein CP12-1, chloroplastic [Nelumbo nucifera]DAD38253.1 TPA_asm: hypothetical protein HUJ06_008894 [Nelumbo nucifera]
MATTLTGAGVSLSTTTTRVLAKPDTGMLRPPCLNHPWRLHKFEGRRLRIQAMATTPERISEKVVESIKTAEEVCAGDPVSGECAAAWDTVEELSSAASHERQKNKESDPLETYCKDNPETDECRTYDN